MRKLIRLGKLKNHFANEMDSDDLIKRMISSPLSADFFKDHTVDIAQKLLGKIVITRSFSPSAVSDPTEVFTGGRIIETEAYRSDDPASHSARGETPRCSVMFGDPGFAYVYFIYGMHKMLNFVTEPRGSAGAVLIRGLEPLYGIEQMAQRRKNPKRLDLTSGPGRLCGALGIEMLHNGQSLQGPNLWVCDDGFRPKKISKSARVGISLAKDILWRFFVTDSEYVSRVKQNFQSSSCSI